MPYGICCSFDKDHSYSVRECLTQAGITWNVWSKFSGHESYPVPSDNTRYPPYRRFWLAGPNDYWNPETQYGKDRMELLDWLIEQLEVIVEKQNA